MGRVTTHGPNTSMYAFCTGHGNSVNPRSSVVSVYIVVNVVGFLSRHSSRVSAPFLQRSVVRKDKRQRHEIHLKELREIKEVGISKFTIFFFFRIE